MKPRRLRLLIGLAALLTAGLAAAVLGTRSPAPVTPPELLCQDCNLIMVSLSNLRRSHMSSYGYKRLTTPNIDRFFSEGIRLRNAFAPASLTYTDSLSLFYSLFPGTHRLLSRDEGSRQASQDALRERLSLPEILKSRGYKTAAFVSDEDYGYQYGLGRVFDLYFDRSQYPSYGIAFEPWRYNVGTRDLIDPALSWIDRNSSGRFFLFLQAYDMHCPYNPAEPFRSRFDPDYRGDMNEDDCYVTVSPARPTVRAGKKSWTLSSWYRLMKGERGDITLSDADLRHLVALYDGELAQADSRLGRFFDELERRGLTRNSVIVFMSEHGDYLGENGHYMKVAAGAEGNLHNANIGFPFLLRLPSSRKAVEYLPIVQTVDLAPTLFDLLGVRHRSVSGMQGRSFAANLMSNRGINEFAYAGFLRTWSTDTQSRPGLRLESLQNREWKLMRESPGSSKTGPGESANMARYRLYHLAEDPNETRDVSDRHPEILRMLDGAMSEARAKYFP